MENFDCGTFAKLAESKLGYELWDFLNEQDSFIRMETASILRRPAVEGIQHELVKRFGARVKNDRVKQMIGKMVRQIMEREGYSLNQGGVRISSNVLFASASRYSK